MVIRVIAVSFAYLIGGFVGKLDSRKRKGGKDRGEKKGPRVLIAFLLVDTTEKMQHNINVSFKILNVDGMRWL